MTSGRSLSQKEIEQRRNAARSRWAKRKMGYSGFTIPERGKLLQEIKPKYQNVYAHHSTHAYNVPEGKLPQAGFAEVVGIADDGKGVQALVLSVNGKTKRPDGSTYHITWSLGPGRKPRESNQVIQQNGWKPIKPRQIVLTPSFFPFAQQLQKRTPGTPLSDAEYKQRKEAARSRWAHTTAAGLAGAVAVGGVAEGARLILRQRGKVAARMERAQGSLDQDAATAASEVRAKFLNRLEQKAKSKITFTGPKSKNWPVPAYHEHLERQIRTSGEKAADPITLSNKGKVNFDDVEQWLGNAMYDKTSTVGRSGTYTRRGDTITIWPHYSKNPIRVSAWDDEIDVIQRLKPNLEVESNILDGVTLRHPKGSYPSWQERYPDAKPPRRVNRVGSVAERKTEELPRKGRIPFTDSPEAHAAKQLRDKATVAWQRAEKEIKSGAHSGVRLQEWHRRRNAAKKTVMEAEQILMTAGKVMGPKARQIARERAKEEGKRPPRMRFINRHIEAKGNVGSRWKVASSKPRIQGIPDDEGLKGMSRELLDALGTRMTRLRDYETKRLARIKVALRAASNKKVRDIIEGTRNVPLSRKTVMALAGLGALAGAAYGQMDKVDRGDLRKDIMGGPDQPYWLQLAQRLARTWRAWMDDPETADPSTDMARALEPAKDAFTAGADAHDLATGSLAEGRAKILAFSFGSRNPEVERAARLHQAKLAGELSQQQIDAIQSAVIDQTRMGLSPEETARRIRESIGLAPDQARHVATFRQQLEILDPRVMNRALRDRRYDSAIRKAMEEGSPLSEDQIDRMTDAYQRRWIAYRAKTIARTEVVRAANKGAIESARQQLNAMPDMTVVKTWVATKDEKTRPHHRDLDGKSVVGLDTPFMLPDGEVIRYPHDDIAPASETINCRCTFTLKLVPRAEAMNQLMEEAV